MTKLQRRIVLNFVVVIVVTLAAVFGMVELKDWVNHLEATRAMENLGRIVSEYKQKNGSVPPESYVDGIRRSLEGQARLGHLCYRARWIELDSPPDTILAYVTEGKTFSLFFHPQAILLQLNGQVECMNISDFDKQLARQQKPIELEMTPKQAP